MNGGMLIASSIWPNWSLRVRKKVLLESFDNQQKQYLLITFNYWAFTLTDGALRMLVLLHFHVLGYSPFEIAMLFLFYEFFGVVTNLVGGWLGARFGLNRTMHAGLLLQVIALLALLVPAQYLSVAWVMTAQAVSGIAKDLNKMSAKSAIKLLVDEGKQDTLFRWVAVLTGSKNTLKGVGFFVGALLLNWVGFWWGILWMALGLLMVWGASIFCIKSELGKTSVKPKFRKIFSKSAAVNYLSAARLFLFCARDVWFVVALPVYFSQNLNWDHWMVGSFFAIWVIGYGGVQAITPRLVNWNNTARSQGMMLGLWGVLLSLVPALLAITTAWQLPAMHTLIPGLFLFGIFFAINSSLHSYLIISFADRDGVSLDVGFYYTANALGRLFGTVLSGWFYQLWGLSACLLASALMLIVSSIIALGLPARKITA